MSQGPLCPNLTQKVQREVSQIANRNLPRPILLGGLSVNLNHLKTININDRSTTKLRMFGDTTCSSGIYVFFVWSSWICRDVLRRLHSMAMVTDSATADKLVECVESPIYRNGMSVYSRRKGRSSSKSTRRVDSATSTSS